MGSTTFSAPELSDSGVLYVGAADESTWRCFVIEGVPSRALTTSRCPNRAAELGGGGGGGCRRYGSG
jgi:hypothetical protein